MTYALAFLACALSFWAGHALGRGPYTAKERIIAVLKLSGDPWVTSLELSISCGLPLAVLHIALASLEGDGVVKSDRARRLYMLYAAYR
jgi:hypothetical protein